MADDTLWTPHDIAMMERALALAADAAALGEVPVGAVVTDGDGVIVGEGKNNREAARDPVGHAELLAIAAAARTLDRWRLSGCTLYVTLEPCFMCAGALVNARVDTLVFGATDPKAGAVSSLSQVCSDPRLNHRLQVRAGLQADRCGEVLKTFFRARRKQRPPDDDDATA